MALDPTPIRRALIDHALASGHFDNVSGHEPKASPGSGLTGAVWVQEVRPVASGLNSTSALIKFWFRIYQDMLMEPQDDIDPAVEAARDALMTAYSGDFTLGGLIRNVDLLGAFGEPLAARAGYLSIQGVMHRVVTINVPCVVNDVWNQAA